MAMPNFLIIGAQKSGTSSLYRYLKSHPQVYMSRIKEPQFFAIESSDPGFRSPYPIPNTVNTIADLAEYQALFREVQKEIAIGEASTWYLHTSNTAARIKHLLPNTKLIVILRHPVERAYSHFLHNRTYLKIEPIAEFDQVLKAERMRREQGWGHPWYYKFNGRYYHHLKQFYRIFNHNQIRVYLLNDLKYNPMGLLQDIFTFLKVDPHFEPDFTQRYNVSDGSVRSKYLHSFLDRPHVLKSVLKPFVPRQLHRRVKWILHRHNRMRPQIDPDLRRKLTNEFRSDILSLQRLIDRDLSHWFT